MARKPLSYATIEDLWIKAGGDPQKAPVMAAIAIAESGGRPWAHNPHPPDDSYGLWQINYYGNLRPGRTREFGSPSALLASPKAQAKAAVAIERQQGLTAWSTYTNHAYRQYLNGADYSGSGTNSGDNPGYANGVPASDATQASDSKPPDCLFGFSLPVAGYVCVLTKGQGRAITGALLLAAGGVVTGAGLIILASYGLGKSGALEQAAAAAAVIPGAGGLAGKVAAGAGAVKRTPGQAAAKSKAGKESRTKRKSGKSEATKATEDEGETSS